MKVDPGNGVNFLIMRTFHVLIVVFLLGACARRQPVPETVRPVKVTMAAGAAVIDKDFASAKLAELLNADMLIILTAVEKVAINFGKHDQQWLSDLTPELARQYIAEGQFAPGSMLPKVQAALSFAESAPGRVALITLLEKAKDGIEGKTGTRVHL